MSQLGRESYVGFSGLSGMLQTVLIRRSYVRMRAVAFGIKPPLFDNRDIHVHVPEGATPKDGPAAEHRLHSPHPLARQCSSH
jgi:hypothetical protein